MASLSGQMGILLLDIMATRTSRCISNSININNNNNSNSNSSTSSSSLSPVSRRTTHTIPTPRNTCPRGTGLPTLQTGTSTPCQANLGRDWSQTVSSSFLSFFFSEVFFNGLTLIFLFQIHPMETCRDFQTRTLGTISRTSCVSRVSTCTDLSMTSLQPPQRATPPPTGASSGRSSFEDPERPARFL